MRKHLLHTILLTFSALLFQLMLSKCVKDDNSLVKVKINLASSPPPTTVFPCGDRPVINARVVPIGILSESRFGPVGATAGSKILFAGGWKQNQIYASQSSRVDIYDMITHAWSTAELTEAKRDGMAVATVGNKILFAGGGDDDWIDLTSRVDIYDASTNGWSTAELSQPRKYLAAATIGNKVLFAGGGTWKNFLPGSLVVDIYDNISGIWATSTLSEGRYELSATAANNKIYFAGGIHNMFTGSKKIDIYDIITDSWSTSQLQEVKTSHVGIIIENKIFWASGANCSYQNGYHLSDQVEIRDLITGHSSFDCISPKARFSSVVKNDYVVFFTGRIPGQVDEFDIYNKLTKTWSIGILPFNIYGAAIVSVNNSIYIAGGTDYAQGPYYNGVWKLEF